MNVQQFFKRGTKWVVQAERRALLWRPSRELTVLRVSVDTGRLAVVLDPHFRVQGRFAREQLHGNLLFPPL